MPSGYENHKSAFLADEGAGTVPRGKTRITMAIEKSDTLYGRILEEFERNIVDGTWPPGHLLPKETELAEQYGVSRMTMNKVLTRLAFEGFVVRRKRRGTVVAKPRAESAVLADQQYRRRGGRARAAVQMDTPVEREPREQCAGSSAFRPERRRGTEQFPVLAGAALFERRTLLSRKSGD